MPLALEELRASVVALAEDVAGAYAHFDPPFDDRGITARLTCVPGTHRAVAERLAAAYSSVGNEVGDGEKAAVLVACETVRVALTWLPAEGRKNLPTAVDVAAGRAAEWVEKNSRQVNTRAEVERIATTAAGNADIGSALCEALARGGRDGVINVNRGEENDPFGIALTDGDEVSANGRVETLVVRGNTDAETTALHYRAITALWSTVGAIADGFVAGGGVAFAFAAESLRSRADEDTVTGLAARAVLAGLESPLRVRVRSAGLNPDTILAALQHDSALTFDQNKPGLVPFAEGPMDAARVVAGAIREAGRTACDLLRLVF